MNSPRLFALTLFGALATAGTAPAAWDNVFQVCCHDCNKPRSSFFAPAPCPEPCPQPCPQPEMRISYVQRCYYQPVTEMVRKTYYEPVTKKVFCVRDVAEPARREMQRAYVQLRTRPFRDARRLQLERELRRNARDTRAAVRELIADLQLLSGRKVAYQ